MMYLDPKSDIAFKKLLGRQVGSKENYSKIVPVFFVGVLDFSLFEDSNDYISHHLILNKKTGTQSLRHSEFHFIELAKFNTVIDAHSSILDKWVYFLKNAETMEQIPATLKDPVLKDAFDILAQGNWSKSELEAYDRYLDAVRSAFSQLETAQALGEEKGRQEGKLQKKLAIAKELLQLKTLDSATIAHTTVLSIEQVEKLTKG